LAKELVDTGFGLVSDRAKVQAMPSTTRPQAAIGVPVIAPSNALLTSAAYST